MGEHFLHFYGSINSKSVETLRNQILTSIYQNKCDKVTILLSSEGGDTEPSFTLYNFLRSLPVPLKMINMGSVDSMAVPIFLSANERYATKNSKFLIHSFRWHFQAGPVDYQRLLEHAEIIKHDTERYINIFNERTSGALIPIAIRQYLVGEPLIVDSTTWTESGIVTGNLPNNWVIPKDTPQYWINFFN